MAHTANQYGYRLDSVTVDDSVNNIITEGTGESAIKSRRIIINPPAMKEPRISIKIQQV